jgi:DNA-binding MarR family transcriptional regulator
MKIQILRLFAILARVSLDVAASWQDLRDRHARVSSALERALEERHRIGLSEFEVLEQLATAEGDHCRMQQLSSTTHLSQSALSRLIGRLEQDGLVERKMCSEDRRGIFAALTDDGRERYEQAKPTQQAVLAEQLGG